MGRNLPATGGEDVDEEGALVLDTERKNAPLEPDAGIDMELEADMALENVPEGSDSEGGGGGGRTS